MTDVDTLVAMLTKADVAHGKGRSSVPGTVDEARWGIDAVIARLEAGEDMRADVAEQMAALPITSVSLRDPHRQVFVQFLFSLDGDLVGFEAHPDPDPTPKDSA